MRRFLKRLGAFLCFQLAIAACVFYLGDPRSPDHYYNALRDKIELLREVPGRRLILAGGSNLAFGVRGEILEAELGGLRPINLGLHAGLGVEPALRCVEEYGRPGDVVVLCFEYEALIGPQLWGNAQDHLILLEQWPAARDFLGPPPETGGGVEGPDGAEDTLWRAHLYVARAVSRASHLVRPPPVYRRSGFNRFGDYVGHHSLPSAPTSALEPLPAPDPQWLDRAIERLNRFAQWCRGRQIEVFIAYPPVPEGRYAASRATIEEVNRALSDRLDVPVLHEPQSLVFPIGSFFDTGYHLTEAAGAERTRRLAESLRRALVTSGP